MRSAQLAGGAAGTDVAVGAVGRAVAVDAAVGIGGTAVVLDLVGALSPSELTQDPPQPPALLPLGDVARRSFAVLELTDDQARDVGYGRPLAITLPGDPTALLHNGDLLALYRPEGDRAVALAVLVG